MRLCGWLNPDFQPDVSEVAWWMGKVGDKWGSWTLTAGAINGFSGGALSDPQCPE